MDWVTRSLNLDSDCPLRPIIVGFKGRLNDFHQEFLAILAICCGCGGMLSSRANFRRCNAKNIEPVEKIVLLNLKKP